MIKLNCDMAEGFGSWSMGMDSDIMPYIDMANIACGFHASDPFIMSKTVRLAKAKGVSIGAHPGYPDLLGFGRREMSFSHDEIADLILYQVGALQAICRANGTEVEYVKPHGALYHLMMRDSSVMQCIMETVAQLSSDSHSSKISLMVLANGQAGDIKQQAKVFGVPVLFEAFCDRAYDDNGDLVSRHVKGAVLDDDLAVENRISELVDESKVTTHSGKKIPIQADVICVHGDNERALASVKKIRAFLSSKKQ